MIIILNNVNKIDTTLDKINSVSKYLFRINEKINKFDNLFYSKLMNTIRKINNPILTIKKHMPFNKNIISKNFRQEQEIQKKYSNFFEIISIDLITKSINHKLQSVDFLKFFQITKNKKKILSKDKTKIITSNISINNKHIFLKNINAIVSDMKKKFSLTNMNPLVQKIMKITSMQFNKNIFPYSKMLAHIGFHNNKKRPTSITVAPHSIRWNFLEMGMTILKKMDFHNQHNQYEKQRKLVTKVKYFIPQNITTTKNIQNPYHIVAVNPNIQKLLLDIYNNILSLTKNPQNPQAINNYYTHHNNISVDSLAEIEEFLLSLKMKFI